MGTKETSYEQRAGVLAAVQQQQQVQPVYGRPEENNMYSPAQFTVTPRN
jgi:hypothetical protein